MRERKKERKKERKLYTRHELLAIFVCGRQKHDRWTNRPTVERTITMRGWLTAQKLCSSPAKKVKVSFSDGRTDRQAEGRTKARTDNRTD